MGEGVIGQVFQTGEPAVIPKVSEEPRFLNRTGAIDTRDGKDVSYISVPIKLENQVIGALPSIKPFARVPALQDVVRLLSIIGSMICPTSGGGPPPRRPDRRGTCGCGPTAPSPSIPRTRWSSTTSAASRRSQDTPAAQRQKPGNS